jgi:hypothetical protein
MNIKEEIKKYNEGLTHTIDIDDIHTIFNSILEIFKEYLPMPENIYLSDKPLNSATRLGQCKKEVWTMPNGKVVNCVYTIYVNKCYIGAPITKEVFFDLVNVIGHELLHTIVQSHDANFTKLANMLNQYLGFKIEAHYTPSETTKLLNTVKPKYEIRCSKCNQLLGWKYHKCKMISHSQDYTSQCCYADIKIINL